MNETPCDHRSHSIHSCMLTVTKTSCLQSIDTRENAKDCSSLLEVELKKYSLGSLFLTCSAWGEELLLFDRSFEWNLVSGNKDKVVPYFCWKRWAYFMLCVLFFRRHKCTVNDPRRAASRLFSMKEIMMILFVCFWLSCYVVACSLVQRIGN